MICLNLLKKLLKELSACKDLTGFKALYKFANENKERVIFLDLILKLTMILCLVNSKSYLELGYSFLNIS